MGRQAPYKKVITMVLLLAASVVLLNVTGKAENEPSFWERFFLKLSEPVSKVVVRIKSKYQDFRLAFYEKKDLLSDNERLSEQIDTLEHLKALISDLRQENARLQGLLGFKESASGDYAAAKVLSRNPLKWFSTLAISLGAEDGVEAGLPVVSRSGLVGRILSSDHRVSTVLLITDPESGVGAMLERSRDFGVVLGTGDPDSLIMRYFSKDADVRPGDRVLTSGLGSKYPRGLLVGVVQSVYVPKPGLVKEATVKPASDIEHLEEVLVMMQ